MSAFGPFFRLPTDLCCAILRDWLFLDSVVRLDSAVCNTGKRFLLWNTIFASSQCVITQEKSNVFHERNKFQWLYLRKVSASGLFIDWEVDDQVREYFQLYGVKIKKLEINHCNAVPYMPLISAHCSGVICLGLTELNPPFLAGDVELLNCNLKALDLNDTQITGDLLELVVKRCPRLTHLSLSGCFTFTDNCGSIISSNLKHLQWLDISTIDLSDTVLLAIAENNHSTLEVLHLEYCYLMIGHGILELLEKCTKLWSLHITYDEDCFENFDFSLLRNLTELSIFNLTEDVSYLHSVVKHCKRLQRLRLDFEDALISGPYSSQFRLRELTVERLPDLKLLAPFGVPEKEIKKFRLMRPEVEIVTALNALDPHLYEMNW
eukprot:gene17004-19380_t